MPTGTKAQPPLVLLSGCVDMSCEVFDGVPVKVRMLAMCNSWFSGLVEVLLKEELLAPKPGSELLRAIAAAIAGASPQASVGTTRSD